MFSMLPAACLIVSQCGCTFWLSSLEVVAFHMVYHVQRVPAKLGDALGEVEGFGAEVAVTIKRLRQRRGRAVAQLPLLFTEGTPETRNALSLWRECNEGCDKAGGGARKRAVCMSDVTVGLVGG